MQMNDMVMVSVDDHVIEPPDMFRHHTPHSLAGRMPHVATIGRGEAWVFEGRVIPNLALNAVVGRRPEEYGFEPTSLAQCRKGCWDPAARVEDMNADGYLAALNYPSWCGLAGQVYSAAKDLDYACRVMQAHNDYYLDEWCAAHPGRFIPNAMVPFWDPALAAKEIRRVHEKGCNSIMLLANPVASGLPSWHQPYWDPIFDACEEMDIVVNLHISDASTAAPGPDSAVDAFLTCMGVTLYTTGVDLVFSPVMHKWKKFRICLAEGGGGWVPSAMDRMDYIYKRHRCWTNQDFGDRMPSEVFRERFLFCVVDDPIAIRNRDVIGVPSMVWENDYPHAEATWPRSPEHLWEVVKDIPDAEIDAITHANALRAYRFDAFAHRPRARAGVGALRAEATHVDRGYLPAGNGIPPARGGQGYVTMRDCAAQMGEAYTLNLGKSAAAG
ncbi:MAG: amidohydrolase family protein [Gammaproteobacteria bacterium]